MVQLTVKTRNADIVRNGLEDLTAEIPKISRLRIYNTLRRAKSRLSTPAPRPTYPIDWDSEKQRRAYFATDGFGGGIPHARTNAMPQGWKLERQENGYRFENQQAGAIWVYGDYQGIHQSRIHAGRHPLMMVVVEEELRTLPQEIEENIGYYARQKGF